MDVGEPGVLHAAMVSKRKSAVASVHEQGAMNGICVTRTSSARWKCSCFESAMSASLASIPIPCSLAQPTKIASEYLTDGNAITKA
jgi:hypothetical protein